MEFKFRGINYWNWVLGYIVPKPFLPVSGTIRR